MLSMQCHLRLRQNWIPGDSEDQVECLLYIKYCLCMCSGGSTSHSKHSGWWSGPSDKVHVIMQIRKSMTKTVM